MSNIEQSNIPKVSQTNTFTEEKKFVKFFDNKEEENERNNVNTKKYNPGPRNRNKNKRRQKGKEIRGGFYYY